LPKTRKITLPCLGIQNKTEGLKDVRDLKAKKSFKGRAKLQSHSPKEITAFDITLI
jgi:hypothetical protein